LSYKSILVQVDHAKACPARIDAAIELAVRCEAHLTGLYLMVEPTGASFARGYLPPEILEAAAAQGEEGGQGGSRPLQRRRRAQPAVVRHPDRSRLRRRAGRDLRPACPLCRPRGGRPGGSGRADSRQPGRWCYLRSPGPADPLYRRRRDARAARDRRMGCEPRGRARRARRAAAPEAGVIGPGGERQPQACRLRPWRRPGRRHRALSRPSRRQGRRPAYRDPRPRRRQRAARTSPARRPISWSWAATDIHACVGSCWAALPAPSCTT
jgi:hypothetical protein